MKLVTQDIKTEPNRRLLKHCRGVTALVHRHGPKLKYKRPGNLNN